MANVMEKNRQQKRGEVNRISVDRKHYDFSFYYYHSHCKCALEQQGSASQQPFF